MAEQVTNGNGKKVFGRRALLGFITVGLVEINFYFCALKPLDISWFTEHTRPLLYILGFIAGTLTITDTVREWKSK